MSSNHYRPVQSSVQCTGFRLVNNIMALSHLLRYKAYTSHIRVRQLAHRRKHKPTTQDIRVAQRVHLDSGQKIRSPGRYERPTMVGCFTELLPYLLPCYVRPLNYRQCSFQAGWLTYYFEMIGVLFMHYRQSIRGA